MAAVLTPPAPPARAARPGLLTRIRWWRVIVLLVLVVYFFGPLVAAFTFTVHNPNLHTYSFAPYGQMFHAAGFGSSLRMTLWISLITIAIVMALMIPTMLVIHLRIPKARAWVETICMVPLVISPVALVAGVSTVLGWGLTTPGSWVFQFDAQLQNQSLPLVLPLMYVVLAMPFVFRSLDAGLRAVDIKTLVEASRNLGGSWLVTTWRVVVPNLRTALLSGSILTLALVFGEYTISSILGFVPFAVWIVQDGQGSGQLPIAVSLLSLVLSWVVLFAISFAGGRRFAASSAVRSM
jgi:putative spermidine/putrescine transport system permease protein